MVLERPDYQDKMHEDKELQAFFKDAAVHSVCEGISVPFRRSDSIRLFTAVTPDFSKTIEEWRTAIKLIAENFHMLFTVIGTSDRTSPAAHSLSERERQTLFLASIGASCKDMGELLGITKRTAEHHIATAKEKLGSRTQTAAVAHAIDSGLIQLVDSGLPQFKEPKLFRIPNISGAD